MTPNGDGPAAPAWVEQARRLAQQDAPPTRLALLLQDEPIGSVAPGFLDEIGPWPTDCKGLQLSKTQHAGRSAWRLRAANASAALNALALALRHAGRCGPWRGEQVAVHAADGRRLASIERGALRVLGIATQAVHLVGETPGGDRLWLQQRAASKATYPLAWDTLVGGMVADGDDVPGALARETAEEAGLALAQLQGLRPGGVLALAHPCDDGGPGCGWVAERVWWFRATLPQDLQPCNQDGEVHAFECLPGAEVRARLATGAFTPEAALVLAAWHGW